MRNASGRARHWLVEGPMMGRRQDWTLDDLLRRVVPEPVLARLVALGDWMPSIRGVVAGVLRGRRVATTHVAAPRAAPQVEPPAIRGETLDAAVATRRRLGV